MFWRKFKLDWSYAIGELIIVTAGVLIALAINQWNSERLDRVEEILIIERLISDLQHDLIRYDNGLKILTTKLESLDRVYSALTKTDSLPDDLAGFLTDVINGSNYGWNQHRAVRTTFDELLSSGKFGLIQNPELRAMIARYYDLDESTNNRIDERETQYPNISYQLVPRGTGDDLSEFELDPMLSELELERITTTVMESILRDHVIAEINFARFVQSRFKNIITAHSNITNELQTYLESNQ